MSAPPLPYTVKETAKIGEGKAGPGRPKGVPNKATAKLKDAILLAAAAVGHELSPDDEDGLVGYLKLVAKSDIKAFASLLGRVLPMEVTGSDGGALVVEIVKRTYANDSAPA